MQLPPPPPLTSWQGAARGQRVSLSWQYNCSALSHCSSVIDNNGLSCKSTDNMVVIIHNCRHTLVFKCNAHRHRGAGGRCSLVDFIAGRAGAAHRGALGGKTARLYMYVQLVQSTILTFSGPESAPDSPEVRDFFVKCVKSIK